MTDVSNDQEPNGAPSSADSPSTPKRSASSVMVFIVMLIVTFIMVMEIW